MDKPIYNINIGDSKLLKELDKYLEPLDLLDISEKIESDYIVPVEIAAKLKNISNSSIYDAINRGKLRFLKGVTLSSLMKYKVSSMNKDNGLRRYIKVDKNKILNENKEFEEGDN